MTRKTRQLQYVRSAETLAAISLRGFARGHGHIHLDNAGLLNEGAGQALAEFGQASLIPSRPLRPSVQSHSRRSA